MTVYEKKVREIAEEMAEVAYVSDEGVFDPEKIHWPEHSKNWINAFMPIASIAVNHMAESWAAAMRLYCDWHSEQLIMDELISLGLIPSPENKI